MMENKKNIRDSHSCWHIRGLAVASVSFVFILPFGCKQQEKSPMLEVDNIQYHYEAWHKSIDAELSAGKSWIYGNRVEEDYLASQVPQNLQFFLDRLEDCFFVVNILDKSSLGSKYAKEFFESNSMQLRQQRWIQLLSRELAAVDGNNSTRSESQPTSQPKANIGEGSQK